jgi:hypothetical protein
MKLIIGWGDMEPREIERMRKALAQIAALATTHLEGIPKEFKAVNPRELIFGGRDDQT